MSTMFMDLRDPESLRLVIEKAREPIGMLDLLTCFVIRFPCRPLHHRHRDFEGLQDLSPPPWCDRWRDLLLPK